MVKWVYLDLIYRVFLGWSQIFYTKIATQSCTIRRRVWNLPYKFHLYLIIIIRLPPELLPVLGPQTFNKMMFNFLGVEHLVNDNGTLVFPRTLIGRYFGLQNFLHSLMIFFSISQQKVNNYYLNKKRVTE